MSNDLMYDVRVVRARMRRGEMTQAEYDTYLATLGDDADHGEETETRFVPAFESRQTDTPASDA